jgi:2-hydroxy-3-keto-5-methylthiopentenyl-1-phosphate phosphatase
MRYCVCAPVGHLKGDGFAEAFVVEFVRSIVGLGLFLVMPEQCRIHAIWRRGTLGAHVMSFVVLSDFDGTVVTIDTAEYALRKFADGDWKAVEREFERGDITFEECLRRQFAMIKVPERKILDELRPVTILRPNFGTFVKFCEEQGIPLIIVSGGLDFYIRHFLSLEGLVESVSIYAPKAEFTANGIQVTFPELLDKESVNFKDDLVRYRRRRGDRAIYVGNGLGDYPAVSAANYSFVIKGSALAKLCRKSNLLFKEIEDFRDATETLKHLINE